MWRRSNAPQDGDSAEYRDTSLILAKDRAQSIFDWELVLGEEDDEDEDDGLSRTVTAEQEQASIRLVSEGSVSSIATELARQRCALANERTLLAWIRGACWIDLLHPLCSALLSASTCHGHQPSRRGTPSLCSPASGSPASGSPAWLILIHRISGTHSCAAVVSIIGFGYSVAVFDTDSSPHSLQARAFGVCFVAVAVACMIVAMLQHFLQRKRIRHSKFAKIHFVPISIGMVVLTTVVCLFVVFGLVLFK